MAAPLFTRLEGRIPLFRHEHVAVLLRGREGVFRLASFLAEGLAQGDLCVYLGPAESHRDMLERLQTEGADPKRHLQTGRLRLDGGEGGFRKLRERTQQVFEDAERLRVSAIRRLEDGSWTSSSVGFPAKEFFDFHALLNYQVKHYPSVALCQYSLADLKPPHLFSAIAVHRHLLVEDTLVRDNPFYIPAEKFIPQEPRVRERDLTHLFREVGFDVEKLLAALKGYGRLGPAPPEER